MHVHGLLAALLGGSPPIVKKKPSSRNFKFQVMETYLRIYVPSWLPTTVGKSRYQTQCNFLGDFETRDFCRVLRNASSNGPRGRLIARGSPLFLTKGRKHCFRPLVKNSGEHPGYKSFAWAVTRSVSQHTMENIPKIIPTVVICIDRY